MKATKTSPKEPMDAYLEDMGQVPLLDAAHERQLAREILRGDIRWRRALCDNPAVALLLLERAQNLRENRRLTSTLTEGNTSGGSRAKQIDARLARVEELLRERGAILKRGRRSAAHLLEIEIRRVLGRMQLSVRALESIQSEMRRDRSRIARLARMSRAKFASHLDNAERRHHALRESRRSLVAANLRLVVHIARGYQRNSMPFGDIVQEGNLGLMRAAEMFNYRHGVKFSTYAGHWIRQAIQRSFQVRGRLIRLPTGMEDRLRTMRREEGRVALRGEELSIDERAQMLKLPEDRLLGSSLLDAISIDQPMGDDGTLSLADTIADEQGSMDAHIDEARLETAIQELVEVLDPRYRTIIRQRFGLGGVEPATLEGVGDELGLSRERIRQLEAAALEKLQELGSRARLDAFLDDSHAGAA